MFCGSSLRCRRLVFSVWLWYFMIILTYFFTVIVFVLVTLPLKHIQRMFWRLLRNYMIMHCQGQSLQVIEHSDYTTRGGGGGNFRVVLVRVCGPDFWNLPQSYTWSSKKMTYSYTWLNNLFTYSYTILWFLYTLFAVKQSLQINITVLVSELNTWAKKWVFSNRDVRKCDHSYNNDEKLGHSYTFFLKKWGLSYTWQRWKRGLFAPHIRTLSYIGSYHPELHNHFGHQNVYENMNDLNIPIELKCNISLCVSKM